MPLATKGNKLGYKTANTLDLYPIFPCCRTTKYDTQAVDSLLVHPKLFPGAEGKSDTAWAISLSLVRSRSRSLA